MSLATTVLAAIVLLLPTASWALFGQDRSPRILDTSETTVRASIGTRIQRLICPIAAPSDAGPLVFRWMKDEDSVDTSWDERYKLMRDGLELRIRNLAEQDSGLYICEATNSYGTKQVEFHLQVFDPADAERQNQLVLSNYSSAPRWLDGKSSLDTTINVRAGDPIELKCPAKGRPLPAITWIKDDTIVLHDSRRTPLDSVERTTAVFAVPHADRTTFGRYVCIVENELGSLRAEFRVNVVSPESDVGIDGLGEFSEPKKGEALALGEPHLANPNNMSVRAGQSAQFQCRVRAAHRPIIKWLREVSDPRLVKKNNPKASVLNAYGMHLLVLDQSPMEVTDLPPSMNSISSHSGPVEQLYSVKLVLDEAQPEHGGRYICVVTNHLGHIVYRMATLNVLESSSPFGISPTIFLYVLLPLVVAFVGCLALVAVCYLRSGTYAADGSCGAGSEATLTSTTKRPPPPSFPPPQAPVDFRVPSTAMTTAPSMRSQQPSWPPQMLVGGGGRYDALARAPSSGAGYADDGWWAEPNHQLQFQQQQQQQQQPWMMPITQQQILIDQRTPILSGELGGGRKLQQQAWRR